MVDAWNVKLKCKQSEIDVIFFFSSSDSTFVEAQKMEDEKKIDS